MKKRIVLTLVLTSFAVSVGAYYELRRATVPVQFETAHVTRGDIVANVVATGTLQAVKTVEVGTQANGIVRELDADFNSVVRKGQVIARLDPSLIQAQIDQGRANVEKAKSDVEGFRVALDEANRQLSRAEALFAKDLTDQSDLDDARAAADQAAADLKSAEAQVREAQAVVDQNLLNLEHTIITAPIDGIVIARNVDVGQTVVSNLQAQTLFEIAEDLTKMQLIASIDESDVGKLREGDPATFNVDAYPGDTFTGTVAQVRLNPTIDQNVVTYDTVIDVPNPDLKLRPGMTANVAVRVDSRQDVLRVPSNALRFKPNDELFGLMHQPIPAAAHLDTASASGGTAVAGGPQPGAATRRMAAGSGRGQVWVVRDGQLKAVPVQLGLSDGTTTEVVAGNLRPGDAVVMNAIATAANATPVLGNGSGPAPGTRR
jgi:HlyD family secretion protein